MYINQNRKFGSLVGSCRSSDVQVQAVELVEDIFRVGGNSRWERNESIFDSERELRLWAFGSVEIR